MKTKLFVSLTVLFLFISCTNEKWPKKDIDMFYKSCIEDFKKNPSISEKEAYKYCNCFLEKIKQKFKDAKDVEKNYSSLPDNEKIKMVDDCIKQLEFNSN